jgi:hypothetical protein
MVYDFREIHGNTALSGNRKQVRIAKKRLARLKQRILFLVGISVLLPGNPPEKVTISPAY